MAGKVFNENNNFINQEKKRKKVVKRKWLKMKMKDTYEQLLVQHEKGIVPIFCAVLILPMIASAVYFSFKKDADEGEIASILAFVSLIVTGSFEIYEWFCHVTKQNDLRKVSTFPCIMADILLIILSVVYDLLDFTISGMVTNIMCSILLLLYILSITFRGVCEYKLNRYHQNKS